MARLATCLLLALVASVSVYAGTGAAPPDTANTGIVKFHHLHDGVDGGKSVLMIQDRKYDSIVFWVDMTRTPTPQTAVLTFSAPGIS